MRKAAVLLLIVLASAISMVAWDDDVVTFRATLFGLNETPPVNSPATGSFRATIHSNGSITFTETYKNLVVNPTVSHIHFGFPGVAGGVMIFLCGGGGQPACPAATSGTIEGTITAANVVGPAAQGIAAGQLDAALQAIAQGEGYVNIHSTMFPGGEIRGQVRVPGNENQQ
jgi:CHRD domain-containing protein